MICAGLGEHAGFAEWRDAARRLCAAGIPPDEIDWCAGGLFSNTPGAASVEAVRPVFASKRFVDDAEAAICHRDPERFARLYRLLWRLQEAPGLLDNSVDSDVRWLAERVQAIRRDVHKMHAFVRFRKAGEADGREQFAAWFEPQHLIVRRAAPFFVRRFTGMDWAILTPDLTATWIAGELSFRPGARREDAPSQDAVEDQWRQYYASIFNPARLKLKSMRQHMPVHYWRNLPEAGLIPDLTAGASARSDSMRTGAVTGRNPLADKVRPSRSSPAAAPGGAMAGDMQQALDACRRCRLWRDATQAVPGEGPRDARLMIVGEQPGDQEDLSGRPFVGPAGRMLDRAMAEAGAERSKAFVTNAVKHFRFEQRGKRRIHSKPGAGEIEACRWWLDIERATVRPKVILALGSTATRGVLGAGRGTLASLRGQDIHSDGALVRVTVHPSYLLRLPDKSSAEREYARFVEDVAMAWSLAAAETGGSQ